MSLQEATLEKCQQENTSLQTSLKNKEEEVLGSNAILFNLFKSKNDSLSILFQVKKLNDSLESTAAKLEESKQLLKTNENGEKRQNVNYHYNSSLHPTLILFFSFNKKTSNKQFNLSKTLIE